jgi:hypothetical protein
MWSAPVAALPERALPSTTLIVPSTLELCSYWCGALLHHELRQRLAMLSPELLRQPADNVPLSLCMHMM